MLRADRAHGLLVKISAVAAWCLFSLCVCDANCLACDANCPAQEGGSQQSEESKRRKMAALLGRSLRTDELTARFYLEEADGDIKAAMALAGN
jgi:hypothetical protein